MTLASDKKQAYYFPVVSPDAKYLLVDAYSEGSHEGNIVMLELAGKGRVVLVHGARHPRVLWASR